MAITTEGLPPPHIAELELKDILKDLGIAPIVLRHWIITVEEDHAGWRYAITLSWRTYRIRKFIDKNEVSLFNAGAEYALEVAGRYIASELYKYNTAEDEEHMEALVLLSMRPTNGPNLKQL